MTFIIELCLRPRKDDFFNINFVQRVYFMREVHYTVVPSYTFGLNYLQHRFLFGKYSKMHVS